MLFIWSRVGGTLCSNRPLLLVVEGLDQNINTRFIELAAEINSKMPQWIIDKINEIFIKKIINS